MFKNRSRPLLLLLLVIILGACTAPPVSPSDDPSALDPRGTGASQIADLWWALLALSSVVFLLVMVILFAAILRRRRATIETPPTSDDRTGRSWILWGGIVMPVMVLLITFGFTIQTLAAIANQENDQELTIDVIGRRWWWEVQYIEDGVNTANEIHIPVGVPVRIRLQSYDVIHSFWVPQIHGKMDAIPGRVSNLIIQADEPGIYRGECAEFCGLQHAHMGFMLVAESQEEYDAWIAAQQQPAAPPPNDAAVRGQQVFIDAGCVYCHHVKGLDDTQVDASDVDLGPDLTHLSSRLTIAAGSRFNNRGNLAGWVMDAQHIKPGVFMPPMPLEGEDLIDLLAYLEGLE